MVFFDTAQQFPVSLSAEGDGPDLEFLNAVVGDGDTENVRREVLEGGFAVVDGLGMLSRADGTQSWAACPTKDGATRTVSRK